MVGFSDDSESDDDNTDTNTNDVDWGFGADEPESDDEATTSQQQPQQHQHHQQQHQHQHQQQHQHQRQHQQQQQPQLRQSTYHSYGTCSECSQPQTQGEIDPEDGLFYCAQCWTLLESYTGGDSGSRSTQQQQQQQQQHQQQRTRKFADATEYEMQFITSIPYSEGKIMIMELYDSIAEYELDEQLGLIEDEAEAHMLASATVETASPQKDDDGTSDGLGRSRSTTFLPDAKLVKRYRSELDSVIEAGMLEKRGGGTSKLGNKRYKKRWFELVRTQIGLQLTYQGEAGNGTLKRAVNLANCRLQNDTRNEFSLHEVAGTGSKNRVYRLRAATNPEKLTWMKALHAVVANSETDSIASVIKQPLPVVSGSMTMQIISRTNTGKARQKWIEVWSDFQNNGPSMLVHDSPIHEPSHVVDLSESSVINDNSEKVNQFSILAGGSEYRCNLPNVSKEKWLEPLVSQSKAGILMQKNSPNQRSPLKLNRGKSALDFEC